MILNAHRWGDTAEECIVCVHGLTQHGGIFDALGRRFAELGGFVLAVDLRGHGESGVSPPWSEATHVDDLFETLSAHGVRRSSWIGHSFGGRLAASAVARRNDPGTRLVMLEPGLSVTPELALRSAETERLDWSFATLDGAVEAIMASPLVVAAPRETVTAYVARDLRKGADGRLRFRHSPAAAVVAWSEMALPAPPVARCPTLLVKGSASEGDVTILARYERELGPLLSVAEVPHGHNMLWEAPSETIEAIESFLEPAAP